MEDIYTQAQSLFAYSQSVRRDLHENPEIGFQEVRTAGIIAQELRALGMEVSTGIAQTGVVGLFKGPKPGPVLMLRFDMDALPVVEETGAEYASKRHGVMHACGHDGHVSVGLTTAKLLAKNKDRICGTVKFVFQPAEEGLGGADGMIREGLLENPKPDYALALHIWNERPVGWVAVTEGPFMSGSDIFEINIHGKGGHGAMPDQAVDPIIAAVQIISGLQSIVSRNVPPLKSAVISVTTIHGGEAFNVIPGTVKLQGTIRAFEPAIRELVVERVKNLVGYIAEGMGCSVDINIPHLTPAVINDPFVTQKVREIVKETIPDASIENGYRSMVSEDMAFMMEKIPGCYFMVGSANEQRGLCYTHHHPKFDFDEQALPRAAALMTAAALNILKE